MDSNVILKWYFLYKQNFIEVFHFQMNYKVLY